MSEFYSPTSRQLQDLFDTRRLADLAHRVVVHDGDGERGDFLGALSKL